jgi:hypothetical protein
MNHKLRNAFLVATTATVLFSPFGNATPRGYPDHAPLGYGVPVRLVCDSGTLRHATIGDLLNGTSSIHWDTPSPVSNGISGLKVSVDERLTADCVLYPVN